jgi:hypothetical protein
MLYLPYDFSPTGTISVQFQLYALISPISQVNSDEICGSAGKLYACYVRCTINPIDHKNTGTDHVNFPYMPLHV